MSRSFIILAPAKYTYENHFLPLIKNPTLEFYKVDDDRYGIKDRKNSQFVVFLDFDGIENSSRFIENNVSKEDFNDCFLEDPTGRELFKEILAHQKKVATFQLVFHTRSLALAWKLLVDIADDENILIMDDAEAFFSGCDYVKAIKENTRLG
jgi:hypothetical protein